MFGFGKGEKHVMPMAWPMRDTEQPFALAIKRKWWRKKKKLKETVEDLANEIAILKFAVDSHREALAKESGYRDDMRWELNEFHKKVEDYQAQINALWKQLGTKARRR